MESCFAFNPISKKFPCSILNVKECLGFETCHFYKTKEEYEMGLRGEKVLKPCPLPACNGEAKLCDIYKGKSTVGHKIYCKSCDLQTRAFINKRELIKYWNTRKEDENAV